MTRSAMRWDLHILNPDEVKIPSLSTSNAAQATGEIMLHCPRIGRDDGSKFQMRMRSTMPATAACPEHRILGARLTRPTKPWTDLHIFLAADV